MYGKKKARSHHFGLSIRFRANGRKQKPKTTIFLHCFPAFCKAGGKKIELIQICCRECALYFCICRQCFRGQAYCCEDCRKKGYRRLHRQVQKRYRHTEKGKEYHRQAEKRRRWRLWQENENAKSAQNKMQPKLKRTISLPEQQSLLTHQENGLKAIPGQTGYCHLCGSQGIIVEKFQRRGYGRNNSAIQIIMDNSIKSHKHKTLESILG